MHVNTNPTGCRWLVVIAACMGLCIPACRREPELKLLPVRGSVKLGNVALPRGTVSLRPNADRGNDSLHHPTGTISPDGAYEVFTLQRSGAPPGHYRVVVFATEAAATGKGAHGGLPRSIVPARYNSESATPLNVEVVAEPAEGAYDLRLEP